MPSSSDRCLSARQALSLVFVLLVASAVLASAAASGGDGKKVPPSPTGNKEGPVERATTSRKNKGEDKRPGRVDLYGDPLPDGAIARLGTTRLRHEGIIQSLFFLPGDRAVVAFAKDGLWMWQSPGG